jgi:hypothetical protein
MRQGAHEGAIIMAFPKSMAEYRRRLDRSIDLAPGLPAVRRAAAGRLEVERAGTGWHVTLDGEPISGWLPVEGHALFLALSAADAAANADVARHGRTAEESIAHGITWLKDQAPLPDDFRPYGR